MKFDFESLSAEPLFYMLMHSGAFVCVLGAIFFVVGLLFGYATWGRFKRQTRKLLGEASSMKDEIASLKRKVGEHSILSGPAVVMATETIYMPQKEDTAAAEADPAFTEETLTTPPEPTTPPLEAPAPEDAPTPETLPTVPTEPPHASPLAAIISAPQDIEASVSGVDAHEALLPPLTELLLPALPELEFQPELKVEPKFDTEIDPKLGFIYKKQPEKTDDLTALKGVAPTLEKRLHEFGVYTYAQIAAWDDDHVKEFSTRLAFKDRIQREQWVEQAREFAIKQTLN
ncbi:hypothetical protein [Prosthecobacter sp.]|uniref:hypothetical protein n=1 Tax=Prosthecobacter sp. TaxID=1965333 RepID=UPI002487811F|nr:hypothetical protein [Prosthecobacter sp.]MDI1314069.1 hypothetical protein [Prosthecobacter sp.]